MKKTNRILTILIFVFLYVPMLVLIVGSFNVGKDLTQFEGFTLHQYVELFQDKEFLKALRNTVVIVLVSVPVRIASVDAKPFIFLSKSADSKTSTAFSS